MTPISPDTLTVNVAEQYVSDFRRLQFVPAPLEAMAGHIWVGLSAA